MSKNAEYQESYRKRREADDAWRLNTYLSGAARDAVVTTSIQQGITRKDALEQLIQTGAAMQTQFRRDDPATDPVSKPRTVKPVSQPATTTRKDNSPMIFINGKPVPTITENGITRMVDTTPAQAPSPPAQMTVAERQELERFKESLPNAIANAEARHVQANGGAAAMSQKERAVQHTKPAHPIRRKNTWRSLPTPTTTSACMLSMTSEPSR